MIAASAAYSIASQWGSYMSAGDPGSCFYNFPIADGRPETEAHRASCLTWIDKHCLPLAEDRVKRLYGRRHGKRAYEYENAVEDVNELKVLRDFFCATPLRESEH